MFDHCLATWRARPDRAPAAHRVFERDGWRCTVPGCTSQRNLHAHHVVFRSAGGSDEDENLTTLCAFHHQRGVHTGAIHVSGSAPGGLVFELPLGRFRAGDVVLATR
jgi:5-methylcytosine-specific restriction endonuclease McrA